MIKIIALGKIKENYLKEAIDDYLKRLTKYHKVELIELKDDIDIVKEQNEILKYIDTKAFNIAMDINGVKTSSEELSVLIDNKLMEKGHINFIIGSSNGLSDLIKDKCNLRLSFGDITLPHGLFRLVLIEQIYRSFKILNNETYHK